jgi:hypothetical protein
MNEELKRDYSLTTVNDRIPRRDSLALLRCQEFRVKKLPLVGHNTKILL